MSLGEQFHIVKWKVAVVGRLATFYYFVTCLT